MFWQNFLAIFTPDNLKYFLQGLGVTLWLSVCVVACSIVFGSFLGVLRNYGGRFVFGLAQKIAGAYIEIFRNTPLLLWMFVCVFLIPDLTLTIKGGIAFFLYTSSVMAEIVRGGLNSIPKGQFEAAQAQGFSFWQTLIYIILPQCFRNIIPSLLSQIVTTIKDSSFLAGLGIVEFTRAGQVILGKYTASVDVFIIFGFLALVYFLICFSISACVRLWQQKSHI
ncbi:amino acid ABC transporter permease [Helicobacter sp. 12S02634-8]|uniref:amino acid ABC transporter permease n=1 Tax=Helicobacter sp. 12S02634-8 TaxID=1476199 RepID=UPI000BA767DE|nr:amino acid ABC transporter permease [Helicobacter sp. 12S02634-8]PAF47369.1 amino acid ABC transporter permease [Helicobacter sp. 12S02634-8]